MRTKVLLLCLMLAALTGLAATRIDAATKGPDKASCQVPVIQNGWLCHRACQCDAAGKPYACTIGYVDCIRLPNGPFEPPNPPEVPHL